MPKRYRYFFKIDAYTPKTIPMARLAEYMSQLASIFGSEDSVHFVELQSGSTVLVNEIEHEAFPKVRDRVHAIRTQDAPPLALKAFKELNLLLAKDNASGVLLPPEGVKPVLTFPGRALHENRLTYGPFKQEGSLDGILIRIGGESDPVPVHVQESPNKPPFICEAKRSIAVDLAPYYLKTPLRVSGEGRWFRNEDGEWIMKRFTITDFKPLKDERLSDVLQRLRSINGMIEAADPVTELLYQRHGDE